MILLLPAGCGSDAGADFTGGGIDTGSGTGLYSVSGLLRDSITGAPVAGAACTLLPAGKGGFLKDFIKAPKETGALSSALTDQGGQYCFPGVPAGSYTLRITRNDYVGLEIGGLAVSGDMTCPDRSLLPLSNWSQLAGSDHPYDPQKYYASLTVLTPEKSPGFPASPCQSPLPPGRRSAI